MTNITPLDTFASWHHAAYFLAFEMMQDAPPADFDWQAAYRAGKTPEEAAQEAAAQHRSRG
jgi:hypothetical protein